MNCKVGDDLVSVVLGGYPHVKARGIVFRHENVYRLFELIIEIDDFMVSVEPKQAVEHIADGVFVIHQHSERFASFRWFPPNSQHRQQRQMDRNQVRQEITIPKGIFKPTRETFMEVSFCILILYEKVLAVYNPEFCVCKCPILLRQAW